jgi:hypothetical protein
MARKRRQLENHGPSDRPESEPVVTYSRREAERAAAPQDFDDLDPAVPVYDAVEVPWVERPPPRDDFGAEPDLRADPAYAAGPLPFEPDERPRRFRHLIVVGIGVVAIAAGIAILLASFGSSTRVVTSAPTTKPAAAPTLTGDTADAVPGVRQIPLGEADAASGGSPPADAASPAAPVAPPAPRPRPDRPATTTVSTEPGAPATATGGTPLATAAEPDTAAAPASDTDDEFIRRIEKTLSRIDAAQPAPAPAAAAPLAPAIQPAPAADVVPNNEVPMDADGAAMDGDTVDVNAGTTPIAPAAPAAPQGATTSLGKLLLRDGATATEPVPPSLIPPADIPNTLPAPTLN